MMATESLGRRRVCPRRRPSREWLGLCGSDGVDDAGGCGGVVGDDVDFGAVVEGVAGGGEDLFGDLDGGVGGVEVGGLLDDEVVDVADGHGGGEGGVAGFGVDVPCGDAEGAVGWGGGDNPMWSVRAKAR